MFLGTLLLHLFLFFVFPGRHREREARGLPQHLPVPGQAGREPPEEDGGQVSTRGNGSAAAAASNNSEILMEMLILYYTFKAKLCSFSIHHPPFSVVPKPRLVLIIFYHYFSAAIDHSNKNPNRWVRINAGCTQKEFFFHKYILILVQIWGNLICGALTSMWEGSVMFQNNIKYIRNNDRVSFAQRCFQYKFEFSRKMSLQKARERNVTTTVA